MFTQDKRAPAFSDTDLMPFGNHSGEPLQDVPASYLAWLWRDGLHEFSTSIIGDGAPKVISDKVRLANYIWNSKGEIEQETGETL